MNRVSQFVFGEKEKPSNNFVGTAYKGKKATKKRKVESEEEKTPEQTQEIMEESEEPTQVLEAIEEEEEESFELDEELVREEIQKWLACNGAAFFHVESTKFLVREKKLASKKK